MLQEMIFSKFQLSYDTKFPDIFPEFPRLFPKIRGRQDYGGYKKCDTMIITLILNLKYDLSVDFSHKNRIIHQFHYPDIVYE